MNNEIQKTDRVGLPFIYQNIERKTDNQYLIKCFDSRLFFISKRALFDLLDLAGINSKTFNLLKTPDHERVLFDIMNVAIPYNTFKQKIGVK